MKELHPKRGFKGVIPLRGFKGIIPLREFKGETKCPPMAINQSSGAGALFELVARGVKDTFFIKDAKGSHFPYDASYTSSAHHLAERKTHVPLNQPLFGGSFEVEIDSYADVMTDCTLEIDMPTWLPSLPLHVADIVKGQTCDPATVNGLYSITTNDIAKTSYGYVNYVGYYLFEKIQFYQDQFLVQEWSGDGLLAKQMTEGSWNSSFFDQRIAGFNGTGNGNDSRRIQLQATPGSIRISLPLPGMQGPKDSGFPLVALPWQTFRIKCTLRKLEDLVICSDPSVTKPAPWDISQFAYIFDDNMSVYTFSPKSRMEIGQPTILLSTMQHYVPPAVQEELRSKPIQIPFRKLFENRFSFGELDFIPLDKGGVAAVTRQLDGRHPTERIFWFFRNQNALDRNQLDNFYNDYFDFNVPTGVQPYTSPYGEFYYTMKLVIAGKDREDSYGPTVWETICQYAKDEKASGKQIGSMRWSIGDTYGTVYPAPRQPEGTINFTTADRPTLYIELANIVSNPLLAQRKAEFRVFTEGWNVYEVKEGRGRLLFSN